MGFNFQAGHPDEIYGPEETPQLERALTERLGHTPAFGPPDAYFCLDDELAWSWWSKLQSLAAERLNACPQILAVDAWQGMYLLMDTDRLVVWPEGQQRDPDAPYTPTTPRASWFTRMLQRLGLRKADDTPPEVQAMMDDMVNTLGTREGERGGFQVGNLEALKHELDELLSVLGIGASQESVETRRRWYSDSDDRIDDDPEVQCLCHAWLTATYAMEHRCPMWLMK